MFLSNDFTLVCTTITPLHRPSSVSQTHLKGTACLHSWLHLRTHLTQLPLSLSISEIFPEHGFLPPRFLPQSEPQAILIVFGLWSLAFLQKQFWLNCLRADVLHFQQYLLCVIVQRSSIELWGIDNMLNKCIAIYIDACLSINAHMSEMCYSIFS